MQKDKSTRIYELLVSAVFFIVGIVFLTQTQQNKQKPPAGQLSAVAFPKFIIFLIIGISAILILRSLLTFKPLLKETLVKTDKRVWISCVMIVVYALAWNYFSFLISTFLYVFAQSKVIDKNRKLFQCALVAGISTIGIYALFHGVFGISFPEVLLREILGLYL